MARRLNRASPKASRVSWNGQQGYGMTEYIERIENGKLAGYPL
jgi:hypothetical protein